MSLTLWDYSVVRCRAIIACGCVLISAHAPEKLPASKVADVLDQKIGLATRFTKTGSTSVADSQSCETPVKQPAHSTSDRNVDVCQPSSMQETQLKQIESSPFPDSSDNKEGPISLHEDERVLLTTAREAQQHVWQQNVVEHSIGLVSEVETCSNNCSSFSSDISSQMEGI